MTPATSFLVVENDAQKAMLQKKQAQTLSGNSALDLGEDAQRMSEASFFVSPQGSFTVQAWVKPDRLPQKEEGFTVIGFSEI